MTLINFLSFMFTFCLLSISSYCMECNLEALPLLRSKQYYLGSQKKIVVFSAPRTGSSVVYNVLRYLFEEEESVFKHHNIFDSKRLVLKTHTLKNCGKLNKNEMLIVVPFRNPIDAGISHMSIHAVNESKNIVAKNAIEIQMRLLFKALEMRKEGYEVLLLYYEDFRSDVRKLVGLIDCYFALNISKDDVSILAKNLSKDSILSSVKHLSGFSEYLPYSGFHGNHISKEKVLSNKESRLLLTKEFRQYEKQFASILEQNR